MYSWFKSYLSNRFQCVIVNNHQSALQQVDYGVPQGSVLGPLLFLLYINDIGTIPNLESNPKLFADDTNIFVHSSDLSELNSKSQRTLNLISDWMLANRLTINCEKTNFMIFTPYKSDVDSCNLNLYLNNFKISKVPITKYLGVQIDEHLDWKIHIQTICQSLRKYVGIFYKLSLKLPQKVLKMLYFSLIYPHILYAVEIYANTYLVYLHDLIILNNRILRILQHKPLHVATCDLYRSFNTLPVNILFQYQFLLHAHAINFHSETLPKFFSTNILRNNDIHIHNTRANSDFHRVSVQSSYGAKLSSNVYAKLWNSLPASLKSVGCAITFRKLLKLYLSSNEICS